MKTYRKPVLRRLGLLRKLTRISFTQPEVQRGQKS
jgi:hypothetical protein